MTHADDARREAERCQPFTQAAMEWADEQYPTSGARHSSALNGFIAGAEWQASQPVAVTTEQVGLAWHDAVCPQADECPDRALHAASQTLMTFMPKFLAALGVEVSDHV